MHMCTHIHTQAQDTFAQAPAPQASPEVYGVLTHQAQQPFSHDLLLYKGRSLLLLTLPDSLPTHSQDWAWSHTNTSTSSLLAGWSPLAGKNEASRVQCCSAPHGEETAQEARCIDSTASTKGKVGSGACEDHKCRWEGVGEVRTCSQVALTQRLDPETVACPPAHNHMGQYLKTCPLHIFVFYIWHLCLFYIHKLCSEIHNT